MAPKPTVKAMKTLKKPAAPPANRNAEQLDHLCFHYSLEVKELEEELDKLQTAKSERTQQKKELVKKCRLWQSKLAYYRRKLKEVRTDFQAANGAYRYANSHNGFVAPRP